MPGVTQYDCRKIIPEFANVIQERKTLGAKPDKTIIYFRNEAVTGNERNVYLVPIELLRYRKYNGRILSDIKSYEANHGILVEELETTQKIICDFLERKDPESTHALRKSIEHIGQTEPAIITCDGFLINGNRRKTVLEKLAEVNPQKFGMMKVVILPNSMDEGGAPTIKEIEHIENRYQLQKDGKSEYYGFDMALSIKRKIDRGLSLKEQLMDDPRYSGMNSAELKRVIKKYKKEYLKPLECIDKYLEFLGREGLYESISTGQSDKKGRWQAFIDYSNFYNNYLSNNRWRIEARIAEEDIGDIEDVAFKIIRKREVPQRKVHVLMRDLPKLIKNADSRKILSGISDDVDNDLPYTERYDKDGREYSIRQIDDIWGNKYNQNISTRIHNAYSYLDNQKERETPIDLLEAALKKLNHDNMNLSKISTSDLTKAMKLAGKIKGRADELENLAYHCHKEFKSLEKPQ